MKKDNLHAKILLGILVIIVISLTIFDFTFSKNTLMNQYINDSIYLICSGSVFIIALSLMGYQKLFAFPVTKKSLLVIVPALIIAVNNFPISAYFNGRTAVLEEGYFIWMFLLKSIATGFSEEIIFRGLVLVFLLQRLEKATKNTFIAVIVSSLLFGFLHIFNIFAGASVGNTLLQVGYSTLMGMLWGTLYIKTKNIWFVIILHGLYNFFGQVLFELGTVVNRYDTFTITITILLGILVAIHSIYLLLHIKQERIIELVE